MIDGRLLGSRVRRELTRDRSGWEKWEGRGGKTPRTILRTNPCRLAASKGHLSVLFCFFVFCLRVRFAGVSPAKGHLGLQVCVCVRACARD